MSSAAKKCTHRLRRITVMLTSLACLTGASSQELRATLFKNADQAKHKAESAQAEQLAPGTFKKAADYYQKAVNDFEKGENLEKIRSRLQQAEEGFLTAARAAELGNTLFSNVLKAKNDGKDAAAATYAPNIWRQAEEKFTEAASRLESGDQKNALKQGEEAETLYRNAELAAIKANFLAETRTLLKAAEKKSVEKYAPSTLNKAESLLKTAEIELERNRYDTDYPRSLAKQAKYEAKHAIFLAESIKKLKENNSTFEDVLLIGENPLGRIAAAAGIAAEFDSGYAKTTDALITRFKEQEESVISAKQEIIDQKREILMLREQVEQLNTALEGLTNEKTTLARETSELTQKIEAQKRIKEKYDRIALLFSKQEAQILRTPENDLIIRLTGLNFASGKAEIKSEYFSLLAKLKTAFDIFPESSIKIEGHTDSFGSDQLNVTLSQERAEAVRSYFLADKSIAPERITASGYGETRPIANNETKEGRAKNRRIDVIMVTN